MSDVIRFESAGGGRVRAVGSSSWIPSNHALDVETEGPDLKDPRKADIYCAAVATQGEIGVVTKGGAPKVKAGARVAIHNHPFDAVVTKNLDPGIHWSDTKIMAHMGGVKDTSLKGMVRDILGEPTMSYPEARDTGQLLPYCLWDAQNTLRLEPLLYEKMSVGARDLYMSLEQPLLPLWAKMTAEGSFNIDRLGLAKLREEKALELLQVKAMAEDLLPRGQNVSQCEQCAHYDVDVEGPCPNGVTKKMNHKWQPVYDPALPTNLDSPEQILAALQKEGFNIKDTGALTLQGLAQYQHSKVAGWILEYRGIAKLLSTYIDPWLAIPEGQKMGGIWNPTGVWTGGRVSSSAFNMQNTPHELDKYLWPDDSHILMTYDNAQLEIRTAAAISGDNVLARACQATDLHGDMQFQLGFTDRRLTKVFVFLTMYDGGIEEMGDSALREGITVTPQVCIEAQATIHRNMPGWFAYAERVRHLDVVEGLFGRRHFIPEGAPYHREKQAINCTPQGGAGDVTKYQMRALDKAGYHIVRQVHDSITCQVPTQDEADAEHDIPAIMEAAVDLGVPLKVERQ